MPTDIHTARINLAIEGGPSDLQVFAFSGREALGTQLDKEPAR